MRQGDNRRANLRRAEGCDVLWPMLTVETKLPGDARLSEAARAVVRGTRRYLRALGMATVTEFVLPDGRRADIAGLGPDGSLTIVEVKSCLADLRADRKWAAYRAHCDQLFFAVPVTLPLAVMPDDTGLIVADAHGAEIVRPAMEHKLAPATRRAVTIRFAQAAADRLHGLTDPSGPS